MQQHRMGPPGEALDESSAMWYRHFEVDSDLVQTEMVTELEQERQSEASWAVKYSRHGFHVHNLLMKHYESHSVAEMWLILVVEVVGGNDDDRARRLYASDSDE